MSHDPSEPTENRPTRIDGPPLDAAGDPPAPADTIERTPPWRYGIGMFGTSIPINVIKGSMLFFYVDLLGMNAAVYATVYGIYGIIDALDNPVFGYLSDRTRSRWGRRKPYLIVGALVLMVGMMALFFAPASVTRDAGALVVWFAVFAILSEMADSLINASYGALLPELFPVERRRALANSIRQGCQLVAMILSLGLTPILARSVLGCSRDAELCPDGSTTCAAAVAACPDPTIGYTRIAVIFAILGAAVIIFMALGVHENPAAVEEERPKFFSSIWQIVTNRYFWTIGLTGACYGSAMALVLGGLQSYCKYVLGDTNGLIATILQVTVIVFSIGFLSLWTLVVRRKGAAWTWRLALAVAAVCFVPLFFAQNLISGILGGVAVAVGYSGVLATNDLVVARVLDADTSERGIHREGIFLSAFGVLGRLNGLIVALALASLTLLFGFESGDNPGPHPDMAFRFYMSVYPFVLLVIGAVMSRLVTVPGSDSAPSEATVEAVREELSD